MTDLIHYGRRYPPISKDPFTEQSVTNMTTNELLQYCNISMLVLFELASRIEKGQIGLSSFY